MLYGDYPSASLRAGSEQLALTLALSRKREWGFLWGGEELFDHYREFRGALAL